MSKQLNTLAPKKWVDNFEGAAPALDYSDGIRVGDFAIDIGGTGSSSSSSGSAGEGGAGLLWRCYDNTEGAPVWEKVIRTASDFVSGNLAAERMPTGGTWTLASALVIDGIHDDLGHDLVVIDGTSVAAPTEPVLKMMSSGSDGRGGRLQLYSAGTAAIDLDSDGASQISPGGTLTLDPASGLAVEANIVFNNAYEDRDFTIRKLSAGDALVYDAGLDKFTLGGSVDWTGGAGLIKAVSANENYIWGTDASADAGSYNTAIGRRAGGSGRTGGSYNVMVGDSAGYSGTTSAHNILIGAYAGYSLTDADGCFAIGYDAMRNMLGSSNMAIGVGAMYGSATVASNTGSGNFALGGSALEGLSSGWNNTAIGTNALRTLTTGSRNTAIGEAAGYGANGVFNIFIGYAAGKHETGDYKIIIDNFDRSTETDQRNNAPIYFELYPVANLGFNGNFIANYGRNNFDFTIRKLTSGDAYTYDAGLDQHRWHGDHSFLEWTGGSGVFGVKSNSGPSYTQIYAEGLFCFDGTHQSRMLTTAIGVGRYPTAILDVAGFGYDAEGLFEATMAGLNASLRMKTTVAEMKFNMGTNIFTVNNNAEDIDIAIKKLSAGDALVYDAGLDKFTLGSYLTSTDDIAVSDTKAFYLGDRSTDGTWRITRSGNNLQFERRESGSYVMKQIIAA